MASRSAPAPPFARRELRLSVMFMGQFMGLGTAEIGKDVVTHVFLRRSHRCARSARAAAVIGSQYASQVLGRERSGPRRQAHQVAEHDGLTALGRCGSGPKTAIGWGKREPKQNIPRELSVAF
jgi:hypothetical protein